MPVQTADSLFRFTSNLTYLLDWLADGFSPRLSLEENYNGDKLNHAMVCFCDIPLAMIENHMFKFGDYGIGMTKEWGVRNRLNPVLYYNKNSVLTSQFFQLLTDNISTIQELFRVSVNGEWVTTPDGNRELHYDHNDPKKREIRDAFWAPVYKTFQIQDLERFFKPREGNYEIKGVFYPNYQFYDEREWRHLPLDLPQYSGNSTQDERREINDKIKAEGNHTLKFDSNDIRYLIVKEECEIIKIVRYIETLQNSTGARRYTPDEIILLTSRILTTTQIKKDF